MAEFLCELVTPEAALRSGPATAVILRTSEGDLTVLAGHTPLVGDVVPGVVRVELGESTERYAVHGGFLQVHTARGAAGDAVEALGPEGLSTRVTLLAGVAEQVGEIDVDRATAARDAASTTLAGLPADPDDEEARVVRLLAEAALRRAELRLAAASGTAAGAQ